MLSLTNRHITAWCALGLFALSAFVPPANRAALADTGQAIAQSPRESAGASATTSESGTHPGAAEDPNVVSRKGVRVEFSATRAGQPETDGAGLKQGDHAEISFRITGAEDGAPVRGVFPGVWLDLAKAWTGRGTGAMECKDRVALYLQGTVGMRPMVDLNSYFILVMNRSPAISVIDPFVGITGVTNLYAQITLKQPPGDWVKTADQRRLFISIPLSDQVAVVDLQTFKVTDYVDVGDNPLRVALQPDGKYLWVGTRGKDGQPGGVTVVDTETLRAVAEIPTGKGHHELAFSADNRYSFVTNRDEGSLSVIDIHALERVKNIPIGGVPISLDFSPLSQALYVADGKGIVSVVDGARHEMVARLETPPGLGPLRVTEDGRWALVVNTAEDRLYVIDASTNRLKHRIEVGDEPYQISFTRAFAYIRSLATERVSMIYLPDLAKDRTPPVLGFSAGTKPPKRAGDLSIADAIAPAPQEAAVLVVSPGDATVYYYMEGMNSPMGAFRNYGQRPRAVTVADRSLSETQPGSYSAKVKMPAAGTYDVAFLLETPEILHCFSLTVAPDLDSPAVTGPLGIEYLDRKQVVEVGETYRLRFRLTNPASGETEVGLGDVRVIYYRAPAHARKEVPAREVEAGVYEAALPIPKAGAYYAYVGVPSRNLKYGDIPFITLRTTTRVSSRTGVGLGKE